MSQINRSPIDPVNFSRQLATERAVEELMRVAQPQAGDTWADAFRRAVGAVHIRDPERVPSDPLELARLATSHASLAPLFAAVAGAAVVRGFESEPDSTLAWTRELPLPNFLLNQAMTVTAETRLTRLDRDSGAAHAGFAIAATAWRLGRFAKQFSVDETDLQDGAEMGLGMIILECLGAAGRRLRPDLVYSRILENPTLADGIPLFDADHGNLGSAPLDAAGLAAGLAAIGGQTLVDADDQPIHLNLRPVALIVPPNLLAAGLAAVRTIQVAQQPDITVLSESRIGAAGLVDPTNGEIRTGSTTNWLLAARPATRPAVVVGGLHGRFQPSTRQFVLTRGQWGLNWDIQHDMAVAAIDHRGVYWSTGAGA